METKRVEDRTDHREIRSLVIEIVEVVSKTNKKYSGGEMVVIGCYKKNPNSSN